MSIGNQLPRPALNSSLGIDVVRLRNLSLVGHGGVDLGDDVSNNWGSSEASPVGPCLENEVRA
jgi:hypothetical protein